MANEPTTKLRLPEGKTLDVYLVQLADGRTVSRTREELEESPPGIVDHVLGAAQSGGKP
jgi:hypothetical protein